jgi:protease-4
VEAGLADGLKYRTEVEELVKEQAGQMGDRLKTAGLDKMAHVKGRPEKSSNEVAVLFAEGEIAMKVISAFSSNDGINEDMIDAIASLRRNKDVKAVVLRVNSPGGSGFLSDQIWHEIVELKKEKPVVVSMGTYAASGGYYISCAASRIFAEPTTLTGSIGVFGLIPNVAGLYKKLDLTTDVVKTNNFSDFGELNRPWREDEKALIQASVERFYDIFLTRCADGRGKTKEEINRIGQGRVWTGAQALERGLVDELGGLDEAIAAAAKLANVDSNYKVTYSSGRKDFLMMFLESQLVNAKISIVESVIGAEEYKHLKNVHRMKSQTGILARLPYEYDTL